MLPGSRSLRRCSHVIHIRPLGKTGHDVLMQFNMFHSHRVMFSQNYMHSHVFNGSGSG